MSLNNKNLLIVGSDPIIVKDGEVFTDSPFLRFFPFFKPHFKSIKLALPTKKTNVQGKGWKIDFNVENLSPLPYFSGINDFILRAPVILWKIVPVLLREFKQADFVLVLHDDFLGILTLLLAGQKKISRGLFIGGNQKVVVKNKYKGLKGYVGLKLASFFEWVDRKFIKKGILTFITGSDLVNYYKQYGKNVFSYLSCLITDDMIRKRYFEHRNKPLKILYAGFLNENKGVKWLIESLQILENEGIAIELNIAGDGPEEQKLKDLAKNLKSKVNFYGFIADDAALKNLFLSNHIFVLPSLSEGIPKVLLEAMAYGLVIISTDVGGVKDIITDGKNGLLVQPKNPREIAEKIKLIIQNPDLGKNLIAEGYKYIEKHTAEKQALEIVENIKKVYFS